MPFHSFIYLASKSPRRAQLLDQLGVKHRPLLPLRGENAESLEQELGGDLPEAYVRRVAMLKLFAAQRRLLQRGLPDAPILAADTTVALGRRMLGKPADAQEATAMLKSLSGRTHHVLTAVAVANGRDTATRVSVSHVRFAELSSLRIRSYVDSGEPFDKAGGYGIQGIGFSNALLPSRRHPGRHPEHGRTRAEHCARGADSPAGPAEKRLSRARSAGYPSPSNHVHRSRKPWRAADPRSPALRAA